MLYLQKHAEEMFWLERRIQFLKTLNDLINIDARPEEAELIAKQFEKVKEPSDLIKRLKEIYGKDAR